MVVQQLSGTILEGLGQSAQQHGELRRVELKQSNQDHLSRLTHSKRCGREGKREREASEEMRTENMQRIFKLNAHRKEKKKLKNTCVFCFGYLFLWCYKRK